MKKKIPAQLIVAIVIVVIGAGGLLTEYFLVKWYPKHKYEVEERTLELLPYRNESLGIEMQVARGLYGKVENIPGGVQISQRHFFSRNPFLTITSQVNPDGAFEFSPQ